MRRPKETLLIREPGQRLVVVDLDSLVALLTHYTDGKVPLDVKIKTVNISMYFERMLGMLAESSQWTDGNKNIDVAVGVLKPLHIRYEGKRVMGWHTSSEEDLSWEDQPETPKRQ